MADESNLVQHARRELKAVNEDQVIQAATIKIVSIFSECGHSGASAHFHAEMINQLLSFQPLGPLTSSPDEWQLVSEDYDMPEATWQNRRNGSAFSHDGGYTYYLLDELKPRRWWRKTMKRRAVWHHSLVAPLWGENLESSFPTTPSADSES